MTGPSGVIYGMFKSCLKTKEFSPLEPGAIECRWYAPGIGNVLTNDDGDISQPIAIRHEKCSPGTKVAGSSSEPSN